MKKSAFIKIIKEMVLEESTKITKKFSKAVEAYKTVELEMQSLVKDFVAEKDPKKKEDIKGQLKALTKKKKQAEAAFNAALTSEPVELKESVNERKRSGPSFSFDQMKPLSRRIAAKLEKDKKRDEKLRDEIEKQASKKFGSMPWGWDQNDWKHIDDMEDFIIDIWKKNESVNESTGFTGSKILKKHFLSNPVKGWKLQYQNRNRYFVQFSSERRKEIESSAEFWISGKWNFRIDGRKEIGKWQTVHDIEKTLLMLAKKYKVNESI